MDNTSKGIRISTHLSARKAYISNQTDTEMEAQYKQKIYDALHSTQFNISTILPMRMQLKYPQHNSANIWNNINKKFMSHTIRTIWYMVVQDIIPTKSRLHNIHRHDTGDCPHCGSQDNIQHRFTICTRAQEIWEWTRARIATLLSTSTSKAKNEWIFLPDFRLYPLQRHNAVVWYIGHMIGYLHGNLSITWKDYIDFLKRTRK
jgi:hypothetical protein